MKSVLINYLGRNDAGPLFSLEMAKAFAHNGWRVCAVISDDIANKCDWDNASEIEKYYIHTYNDKYSFVFGTIKFLLQYRKKIAQHYKDERFDFIVKPMFHLWSEGIDTIFKDTEVVSVCHDVFPHSGESKLVSILNKRYIKNTDYAVVLTKGFIEDVAQLYGLRRDRVIHMRHGVFDKYKACQRKDKKINYDEDKFNFVFFGRIQKYKGLHILSEAYKKLKAERDDITLTIAGSGNFDEYRDEFSKLKDVNIINEYIPDEEVGCYFDGPNIITVLPYIDATQSGVIPIAYEYKSVIVASDTGGLREQLDDGNIGVLFKPSDADDLAEKMNYIVDNREERERQIELMEAYLKNCAWDTIVDKLMRDIEKVR